MKISVTVIKSTASKNGGFVNSLVAKEQVKSAFGTKTIERKLFIKSEEQQVEGEVIEIDLDDFNVTTVTKDVEINGVSQAVSQTWLKEKSSLDKIREVASHLDTRATVVKSGNF